MSQVARTGRLVTTVTFDWDADLDLALVDVQKAVGGIEGDPQVDEVVVRRFDPRQSPILTLGLVAPSGKPDLAELRQLVRRQVAPALEQLAGRRRGARDRRSRHRDPRLGGPVPPRSVSACRSTCSVAGWVPRTWTSKPEHWRRATRSSRFAAWPATVAPRMSRMPWSATRPIPTGASKAVRVSDLATVETVDAEIDHLVLVDGVEGVGVCRLQGSRGPTRWRSPPRSAKPLRDSATIFRAWTCGGDRRRRQVGHRRAWTT